MPIRTANGFVFGVQQKSDFRCKTIQYRYHDNVIKWKLFPRYWPFVRGIHRSPVIFPHKGPVMLWCCSAWAVKQTVERPMIWGYMTFMWHNRNDPADTSRDNDVVITSQRRHFDVINYVNMTSFWRYNDVIIASCVQWGPIYCNCYVILMLRSWWCSQFNTFSRDKMADILQTIFSNAFSRMKMCELRLRFYWSLFLSVQTNNIPALILVMAWRQLSDPEMTELTYA